MPKLLTIENQVLRFLAQLACLLSILALTSCGGSSSNAAPSITSLTASISTIITLDDDINITPVFTGGIGTTATVDNSVGVVTSGVSFNVTPTTTTTYTLTVSNSQGTVTKSITVFVVAAPTASLVGTATITIGSSTNLISTFISGGGEAVIDNGVGTIDTSGDTSLVSPIITTTYTLTVTSAAGLIATSSVTVTVVAAPTASLAGTATITVGNSTNLISTFISGGGEAVIDNGVGTINTSGDTSNVSPSTTTTYTLTVTNAAGAIATSSVTVTVVAKPTLTLSASATAITAGNSVNITATFTSDSATTGTVTNNRDATTITVSSGVASPTPALTISTTYSLTITNSLGFPVTKSISVSVLTPPPPTPTGSTLSLTTFTPMTRVITDTTAITILFDKDMNSATLSLGGSLAAQTNNSTNSVFGSFILTTDFLTITPTSGTWSPEIGATLTIDADSQAGGSLTTMTLTFDIATGTIFFVDPGKPDDTGDGLTPATAEKTIQAAIDDATPSNGDFIAIAEGTHSVDSGTSAILLEIGVPIYGGYKSDFTDRDTVLFETIVTDTSSTVTGDATAPNAVIQASTGITSSTIVDGLTLNGSSNTTADFTSAILIINGANPIIENNIINGGGNTTNDTSYGIYTDSSNPTIRNNLINGGSSPNSYGLNINTATSAFILRNNTINAGSGSLISHGIENTNATPKIENNIVFSSGGAGSNVCYFETDTTAPSTMFNNYLFNCSTALYNDSGAACTSGSACTIADMEALLGGATQAKDNIDTADATFANFTDIDGADNNIDTMGDNDWHISVTSPAASAGLNGIDAGFGFTLDHDGVTRPATTIPWAIGAYEP